MEFLTSFSRILNSYGQRKIRWSCLPSLELMVVNTPWHIEEAQEKLLKIHCLPSNIRTSWVLILLSVMFKLLKMMKCSWHMTMILNGYSNQKLSTKTTLQCAKQTQTICHNSKTSSHLTSLTVKSTNANLMNVQLTKNLRTFSSQFQKIKWFILTSKVKILFIQCVRLLKLLVSTIGKAQLLLEAFHVKMLTWFVNLIL